LSATTPASPGLQRTFYGLGTLLMVVGALYWGRTVLLPLALAALFAFILTPAVFWLERHRTHRTLAVLVVVALVFAVLAGLGYFLTLQVGQLADQLPQHTQTIKAKVESLRQGSHGTVSRLLDMVKEVTGSLHEANQEAGNPAAAAAQPPAPAPGPNLHWLSDVGGIAADFLAQAALVAVLVVFMLAKREDLRDRVIRLLGGGHLTATTRALDEASSRISRYLILLVLVNAVYGTVLSIALFFIGVPFALLWGFVVATLRFIPYVGVWIGAAFPLLLSAATSNGWTEPLLVLAVIIVLELLVGNVLEPILYGRSMGVSEVALLVSAAFWAWLWGPVGLVLSVPLTVCVAVLGKYVPQLKFFEVLLRDEPVLSVPVRYYQRLLAHDEDEAGDLVEEYLKGHPPEEVFDEVLLPALALARRDIERGELEADEREAIYQTTRQVLDDLVFHQQQSSEPPPAEVGGKPAERRNVTALAFPAHDEADELALRMLAQMLEPSGCRLEVFSSKSLTAELLARACEERPPFVVIGALPPGGMAQARHLCKRLRAGCPELKVFVIRWGQADNLDRVRDSLREAGADGVVTTLREASTELVPLVQIAGPGPAPEREPAAAAT
jgi:predicted PurR-regulated permease PerM/CheY-like chemotaxis protein